MKHIFQSLVLFINSRHSNKGCQFVRQVSFVVPNDAIPARLGLLLTLALCTINTLNSVVRTSPKSGGDTTALVKWIWACLAFIVMAVLEYSLILAWKKFKTESSVSNQRGHEKGARKDQSKRDTAKVLDTFMILTFPPTFFAFAILFWSKQDSHQDVLNALKARFLVTQNWILQALKPQKKSPATILRKRRK